MNFNRFILFNNWSDRIEVFVEPEGAVVELGRGESLSVKEVFRKAPVTVKLGKGADGLPVLSIWPGDGDMAVEKDGVNVLGAEGTPQSVADLYQGQPSAMPWEQYPIPYLWTFPFMNDWMKRTKT